MNDFDNAVLQFTFRADENEPAPTNEIEVPVPIADDAINEPSEEIFVVTLNLTDSVNPSGVVISRVSSLCRIIDNDREYTSFIVHTIILNRILHVMMV